MFPAETVFNQSIWGDEGFSAILSMKSLPEIIKTIANDTSPPLWNIFEWLIFNTLGTDEVFIRGLAFTFFALAVFFTYKIAKHLWDRNTAVLAAMATFLNPFFFIYAFEGRMYSILALGVTASWYYFLKILHPKGKASKYDSIGFVAATLWALYSHHFSIFSLLIQGVWFIYHFFFGGKKEAKRVFKLFIYAGIGYLPWLYPLYKQTSMVGGGFWLGTPTIEDLGGLIKEYLAVGITNTNIEVPILNIFIHELAWINMLSILAIRKWGKETIKTLYLLSWFLGPIILTWLVSQVFQSVFFNRYLLYAIPAAMLVVVSNKRRLSYVLISSLFLLFLIIDFHYFTHPRKLPFRQLASWVKQTRGEGDILINWNAAAHHLWETKYYGIPAPIYIPGGGELPFFVGTALMEEEDIINAIPQDTKRVGVVTSGSVDEVSIPGYTKDEIKHFDSLKFIWLENSQE
ncbi:MAG: glycosyltransferase family 39 protein [Candidatus Woesebacteria bacterium]|jgi:mannosyltransferase